MTQSLTEKALEFILNNQKTNGNFNKIKSYEDLFECIETLSKNNFLKEAKKSLSFCIKHQTSQGNFEFQKIISPFAHDLGIISPVFFLKAITEYLSKINCEETTKNYSKEIKKAINYLEKTFCDTYILLYHENQFKVKTFSAYENSCLLNFADTLTELLNRDELITEADKLFMIKGKIELGFQRYFYFKKENILISEFQPQTHIAKNAKKYTTLKILNNIRIEKTFTEKKLKEYESSLNIETNTENILLTLNLLKKNSKKYISKLKEIEKYLYYYPELILNLNKTNFSDEIEKRLFKDFKKNIKEFNKEKTKLIGIDELRIAILISNLMFKE